MVTLSHQSPCSDPVSSQIISLALLHWFHAKSSDGYNWTHAAYSELHDALAWGLKSLVTPDSYTSYWKPINWPSNQHARIRWKWAASGWCSNAWSANTPVIRRTCEFDGQSEIFTNPPGRSLPMGACGLPRTSHSWLPVSHVPLLQTAEQMMFLTLCFKPLESDPR